jgi:hypothetical protein
MPLGHDGQIDILRSAKLIRRALMIVGGAVISLVVGFQQAISYTRDHAEKVAAGAKQQAHQGTEDVYQPLLHKVEALTAEVLALRKIEAERARAEQAQRRRTAHRPAVVTALPPVPPALTKALPKDVDTASREAQAKIAPPKDSPRGVDSGVN